MQKTIRTSEQTITPERAARLLQHCAYPLQRKLWNGHVQYLATAMRHREFYPSPIHVCALSSDPDNAFLVDGQHRLAAIVECGIPQKVFLIESEVDTEQELGRLYASIDRGRARGNREVIRPIIGDEAPSSDVAIVSSAALFAESGFTNRRTNTVGYDLKSPFARVEKYRQWEDEYEMIKDSLSGASKSTYVAFKRVPLLSVFLVTGRYQCLRTKELLEQIAANDGLKKLSPAWQMVNTILPRKVYSNEGGWPDYARQVASVWNAHYRGDEQLARVQTRAPHLGMLLLGTPYKG